MSVLNKQVTLVATSLLVVGWAVALVLALPSPVGAGGSVGEKPRAARSLGGQWHLLFVSDRDGDNDVYAVGEGGGRIAALTRNRVDDQFVDASADGRWFLETRGLENDFLVSADGRSERRLYYDSAFAPDGRTVATTRLNPDYRVLLVRVGGDKTRDLGSGSSIGPGSFSPNGQLLAYEPDVGGSSLGMVDVRTGRRWRFLASPDAPLDPGWSPSGKWFAGELPSTADKPGRLFVVAAMPGARPRILLAGAWGTWLPGDRLGVWSQRTEASPTEFRFLDVRGRTIGPVRHDVETVSPDGLRVTSTDSSANGSDLVVLTLATGDKRVLHLNGSESFGSVTWSPSGRYLAAQAGTTVSVLDVKTGTVVRLGAAKDANSMFWSGDERALAWTDHGILHVATLPAGSAHVPLEAPVEIAGWVPGPLPRTAPTVALLRAPEIISPRYELRSDGHVRELASDGTRVAVLLDASRSDCAHVVAWQLGAKSVIRFEPPQPRCPYDEYLAGLALTGTSISWSAYECHNECYHTDIHANTLRPGHLDVGDQTGIGYDYNAPHPAPPTETRRGVSISVSHGTITLHRAIDRRTRALRPPNGAVDAELETAGLFYAYNLHRGDRPGRVVFVPFAQLFP